ncbi:hypothetical protein EG329_009537 [Mollisiaceae sp. DMI_Dod_QoI]|nr:hypothetical protein EG329_009537 [Helotiales sp. DMI_Dod_QoI]
MDDTMHHSFHEGGYGEVNEAHIKGNVPGKYEHDGLSRLYKHRSFSPYREDEQDDQSSDSGPSMTTASSARSASCSVIQCDGCESSNEKCACPDSGRLRFLQMDHDHSSARARSQSPAMFLDRCRTQKSPLYFRSGFRSPQFRARSSPLSTGTKFPSSDSREESNFQRKVPSPVQEIDPLDCMELETTPIALHSDEITSNMIEDSDSRSESEEEEEEEDESDHQSTTQDDELEAMVLNALGGDLGLAAHLIPILHKSLYMESISTIKQKVDPWRNGIKSCSPGGGGPAQTPSSTAQEQESGGNINSRKRQRRHGSSNYRRDNDEEENEDEGDDDNQGSKDAKDDGEAGNFKEHLRLACPFHKNNPRKYCIQHDLAESTKKHEYRSCEGPGFTSIQRLNREHLKRKYYPVQCDRCYDIFPGSDRARCVTALEAHRQQPNPCKRAQSDLKEGISDAKWAQLEKKKTAKQSKESSRIEKYWEIWDILFPGVPRPSNPWYEDRNSNRQIPYFSSESQHFTVIFAGILEHQVRDRLIRFPEGCENDMKARIEAIAQRSFELYVNFHGVRSSRTSSSSRSQPQSSYIGGSYGQISNPSITEGSRSASRSISVHSQLPVDMQGPSNGPPMPLRSRGVSSSMGPPAMQLRQILPPDYVPTLPSHSQQSSGYSMNYQNNMPTYTPPFENSITGNNGSLPFTYDSYSGSLTTPYPGSSTAGTYRDMSQGAIDPSLMVSASDPNAQALSTWQPGLDPRDLPYYGSGRH